MRERESQPLIIPGDTAIPAGSLRCDRLVKSSLASSMVGFINGGNCGSLPDWRPSAETSMVLD